MRTGSLVCVAALLLTGCIAAPSGVPIDGYATSAKQGPVKLSATFSYDPDKPRMAYTAWAKNEGTQTVYTRGTCYTPWSSRILRGLQEVPTGPPKATCQPISWSDVAPGVNATTVGGWNGTTWAPHSSDSFDQGRYERAPPGDYRAEVTFSFYDSKDEGRYCCPQNVRVDFTFRV